MRRCGLVRLPVVHGSENEGDSLLGRYALLPFESLPTFQRFLLLPSSGPSRTTWRNILEDSRLCGGLNSVAIAEDGS
jgi:hypothetical protein